MILKVNNSRFLLLRSLRNENPIGFGRKSEENVSGLKYFEQLFCRLVYYKRIQKGEISNC